MWKKIESCPSGDALEQQMELEGFCEQINSTNNYKSEGDPVSRFLLPGQENAVPLRHLVKLTGWDGRTVRLAIQRERLGSTPILADNQNGYFLPATEEEKARCVKSMRHRAREILAAADGIERAEAWRG